MTVVVILIIFAAAVVIIIILVVYVKTKGWPSIFKSGTEYKKTDNEGQRVKNDGAEGPEEGEVHVDIVEGDGPGTRRAPRTPEEQQPLLRQRTSRGDIKVS